MFGNLPVMDLFIQLLFLRSFYLSSRLRMGLTISVCAHPPQYHPSPFHFIRNHSALQRNIQLRSNGN